MNFHTLAASFDAAPGDPFHPAATPIYQTATFEQESPTELGPYDYSRSGNPTRAVLERQLARLERAEHAFAFSSGLAALTAVTRLLAPGDEIVAGSDLYGGSVRLFSRILAGRGVRVRYAEGSDAPAIIAAISPATRLVHVESPTNPLQRVCDIRRVARAAREAGALLCVDNTMLSPYLQNPLELGADVVIHSATKFLCGHSDVTAGAACVRDGALAESLYLIQNGEGAGLAPFESYLLLRGIKTLALRLDRQQESARRIAEFLASRAEVRRVHYLGLGTHPGREVHAAQARGPGAVLSFETGDPRRSEHLLRSLRLFGITVSFGGINSTASLPARMSHASVPPELRARQAPPEDLVRLSIGIEGCDDLIDDLSRGLEAAFGANLAPAEAGA